MTFNTHWNSENSFSLSKFNRTKLFTHHALWAELDILVHDHRSATTLNGIIEHFFFLLLLVWALSNIAKPIDSFLMCIMCVSVSFIYYFFSRVAGHLSTYEAHYQTNGNDKNRILLGFFFIFFFYWTQLVATSSMYHRIVHWFVS